ncbi:Small integral membrane protein [Ruminococcaceae bacterium YRB3002]|nr:Small integral membrane protein [Ruminococcaceae bacterium YRB3002]
MERLLSRIFEKLQNTKAGVLFAAMFFVVAILLCIFGFFRTLFIILFTLVGFFVGSFLFSDSSRFKKFLDRILPPGRFR